MPTDPAQCHVAQQWQYTSPLIACRFDPKQRYVFSTAEDNQIQRWAIPSGEKITFTAHDSWVFSLELTTDGETLLTGGETVVWSGGPPPLKSRNHSGWSMRIMVGFEPWPSALTARPLPRSATTSWSNFGTLPTARCCER